MTNQLVIPFEEINQRRRDPYRKYDRFLTNRCYEAFDGRELHWERHCTDPGACERS